MAEDSPFMSLSAAQLEGKLLHLLQRIACEKGRIEVVDDDGVCDCVLISKAELDSLERALAVLSDTDGVRHLCQSIASCVSVGGDLALPAAQ